MKYQFTVTLNIKENLGREDLKVLARDIKSILSEQNSSVGLGFSDEEGESWYATSIKVEHN